MFDYSEFVSLNKSALIAPAGYGKTHTISECINYTPENNKQLILTHTHAGLASIKEKLKNQNVQASRYHLETITGFAQKYVIALHSGKVPQQDKSNEYFSFIVNKAKELFRYKSIQRILLQSYQGLFVDEYQDCTKSQHEMIESLSDILPTHILGDPLQGIMNFNGDLVDFKKDLKDFTQVVELKTPFRWFTDGNNKSLGEALIDIRAGLTQKEIDFSKYNNEVMHYIKIQENDIRDSDSTYRKALKKLIINPENKKEFNSLLILMPEYSDNNIPKGSVSARAKLKSQFDYTRSLTLLEAIDDKSFYSIAKKIDDSISTINKNKKPIKKIVKILESLFLKVCIRKWFTAEKLIKKGKVDEASSVILKDELNIYLSEPNIVNFKRFLIYLKKELKFRSMRDDLFWSVIKALDIACTDNISVIEGMVLHKNIIRRVGRKIHGKCIGTTALTKGLEFDTVAILNAHRFECPKQLYVALTRASKKLIVFSEKEYLNFN